MPFLPEKASAKDELFKPNALTNPLLEQVRYVILDPWSDHFLVSVLIHSTVLSLALMLFFACGKIRIWEQAEADDIKYGGELTRGDAGNRGRVDQYPKLLVPILQISDELHKVDKLVHGKREEWAQALEIFQKPQYDKINFKRTFNAFADNVYYSDPDRANLYLGGGATPKTEQSIAYLLRNDILTNVEDLQAELEYLLKVEGETDTEDLYKFSTNANIAMAEYLKIVSPYELNQAKNLLKSEPS